MNTLKIFSLIFYFHTIALLAAAQTPINVGTAAYAVYLLKGEQIILVDTGKPGMEQIIEQNLQKHGVQPKQVAHIILTHGHFDHVGTAAYFKQKYGTSIIVGGGDEQKCTHGKSNPYRVTSPQKWLVKRVMRGKKDYTFFEPSVILQKYETLDLNVFGIAAQAKVVGGHTEGSLIIKSDNKSWVIVGDLVRGSVVPLFHKTPRIHFFAENPTENNVLLRNLLDEGFMQLLPSHFGPLKAQRVRKHFFKP